MRYILILMLTFTLASCSSQYRQEGTSCRDMETGQYTNAENCK